MKISRIIMSLMLMFALMLTGCGNSDEKEEFIGKVSVPDGAEILSNAELKELKKWFNDELIRVRFLHSTYETPKSVNLYSLFYFGSGEKAELTTEDIRDFLAQFGWWGNFDIYRVTETEIENILTEYANISFDDTDKVHLSGLYNVKAGGYYYSMHSNVDNTEFDPIYGYTHDGYIYLFYQNEISVDTPMEGYFRVAIRKNGESYHFISNEYCEESTESISYKTEIYHETDYEDIYSIEEKIDVQAVEADLSLSADDANTASANIREQTGFEEIEINGQSWVNVSEYGTVVSGTLDGQIKLYFVTKAGKVLSLPIPHETAEPEEMLFGGGDIIFEYMMQSASLDTDEFGMPKELTSWYCTLLLPTNEIFVRTVQSTLAE